MNPMSLTNGDRALVFHLQCDHRAVADALRAIEKDFNALTANTALRERLIDELESLYKRLVDHFREEEEGGCLEEAVCRRPTLAAEARRIEKEHPDLLSCLRNVIDKLGARRTQPADEKLRKEFEAFAHRLRDHECAEDRLMEKGMNINMEAELDEIF